MSAEPISEPTRRTDGDALARLNTIDHLLHQTSTQPAALGESLSQLDEIRANLTTLTESLQSAWRASHIPDKGPYKFLSRTKGDKCQSGAESTRLNSRTKRRRW